MKTKYFVIGNMLEKPLRCNTKQQAMEEAQKAVSRIGGLNWAFAHICINDSGNLVCVTSCYNCGGTVGTTDDFEGETLGEV